jgi:hypothetical protein
MQPSQQPTVFSLSCMLCMLVTHCVVTMKQWSWDPVTLAIQFEIFRHVWWWCWYMVDVIAQSTHLLPLWKSHHQQTICRLLLELSLWKPHIMLWIVSCHLFLYFLSLESSLVIYITVTLLLLWVMKQQSMCLCGWFDDNMRWSQCNDFNF